MTKNSRIAFIGGGNMARALIGGLLKRGLDGACIAVSEPFAATREALLRDFPVRVVSDNREAVAGADIWVLAVKPQSMAAVLAELRPAAEQAPLVISIAAGIRLEHMRAGLGPTATLVRAMPNTPALVGEGITVLCADAAVPAEAREQAATVLASVGATLWLDDESLMDAVTAVSGSGPAYFFRLMEGMLAGAEAAGLTPEMARALVLQTALGAARLASATDESPETLRRRVTSPGGTTAAAIAVLEQGGFGDLVRDAVLAATARGKALAGT